MIDKDILIEDKIMLREGFKRFLEASHPELKSQGTICSDAFYLFKNNLGMEMKEVLYSNDGIQEYKRLLVDHFKLIGRKNPQNDANSYCRAIGMLRQYIDEAYTKKNSAINTTRAVKEEKDICRPSNDEVMKYLQGWENIDKYKLQDKALEKLFLQTYTENNVLEEVLVKVSTLNDFYSTNIFETYKVAKHITMLNIDERLKIGDITLVNDVAKVDMGNEKVMNLYSFATKYCSHHKPLQYPIYDSYIDDLLRYFRDVDNFVEFRNSELKDYIKFKNIIIEFQKHYKLEGFNLKEIDQYLWQLGKEKFPKHYSKKKHSKE